MGRKTCGKDAPTWILLTRWLMNNGYEQCQWCGSTEELTFDHILPYSYSGKREQGNLAILCNDCNVLKDNDYYTLEPCSWPNPAFPQIQAEDLIVGMVTVYGTVAQVNRVTTKSGKTLINIDLTGDSILGAMRKREIKNISREPNEIVFLDPRSHEVLDRRTALV